MKGTVKKWIDERGYGFIAGDDGKDYFVHQSEICMKGHRELKVGQRVSFDADDDGRGPRATGVIIEPGN